MKEFLIKYKGAVNILLPIIVTGCIFYSDTLGQKISEIRTNYLTDIITINNSFITLNTSAVIQDSETFQKTKNNIEEQLDQLNRRYSNEEIELRKIENLKKWFDIVPYVLILILVFSNIIIFSDKEK